MTTGGERQLCCTPRASTDRRLVSRLLRTDLNMDLERTKASQAATLREHVRTALSALARGWRAAQLLDRTDVEALTSQEQQQQALLILDRYSSDTTNRVTACFFTIWTALLVINLTRPLPSIIVLLAISLALPVFLNTRATERFTTARMRLQVLSRYIGDVAFVPHLLDFVRRHPGQPNQYTERIKIAAPFLRRLLPEICQADTDCWTSAQCRAVCDILSSPLVDFDLTIRVLRVAAFCGDRQALECVRALSMSTDWYVMAGPRRRARANRQDAIWVMAAAGECLPLLEERVRLLETATTLLRTTNYRPIDSLSLLRSSSPATPELADGLLHAYLAVAQPDLQQTGAFVSGYDVQRAELDAQAQQTARSGSAHISHESSRE